MNLILGIWVSALVAGGLIAAFVCSLRPGVHPGFRAVALANTVTGLLLIAALWLGGGQ